jgi:hypothetical protein
VASSLDPSENPENMPELMALSDEEFDKAAIKYNAKRDVFGFSSIVSLSYSRKKLPYLQQVYNYILSKAEKHCPNAQAI